MFRGGRTGTAWFDDFYVGVMTGSTSMFDGLPVLAAALPAPAPFPVLGNAPMISVTATEATVASTGVMFRLQFATGRIDTWHPGTSTVHASAGSGLLVRDMAYATDYAPFTRWVPVATTGNSVTVASHHRALGLYARMVLTAKAGGMDAVVSVNDTTGAQRALTLYFAVALNTRTSCD
jgi:hypothetical protein